MENMTVGELMVPTDRFPKISESATFYEALMALETAQEKYLAGISEQRILLVENEAGKIMGKISPVDLLRGLETNYNKIDAEKTLSRFGLSTIWKTFKDEHHLWENPFKDLCQKADAVQIKDFIKGPAEGQSVGLADPMAKCFHSFVMNRHDALFVVENDQIVGLLKFSDVYQKASATMKACQKETR